MKLRTEMVEVREGDSSRHDALVTGHYDAPVPMWIDAANHDAACAHALMQAQDEFWKQDDLGDLDARDAVEMIGVRADELLREWGFDSGEVE